MNMNKAVSGCCSVLLFASISVNAGGMNGALDEDTGRLAIEMEGSQPLEKVLKTLSVEMGFELELGQPGYGDVSGNYSGKMRQVINKLVRPASVFISGSDSPPYNITRLVLLPTGDEQSKHLPEGVGENPKTAGGVYTGPRHNREKFERRMNRGF